MKFSRCGLCAVACAALVSSSWATEAQFVKKTYTYKTADRSAIEADVYSADDTAVRPGVVWMHGGALINGSRGSLPGRLVELCRSEGFVLVSIDYRLAPEVKLPAIIEDVTDAWTWIRKEGPGLFHVDPEKLVAVGGSAGGYLTMMTGICVEPPPVALVAYWGYGDVDGPWYTEPSEHYRTVAPLVSEEEARSGVGQKVITGTDAKFPGREGRSRYYLYLRQNGLWTKEVTGFDPKTERAKLDPYCPARNITPDYPTIFMVHGTVDTDVPYELSDAMHRELTRHGVSHTLFTVPAAGHGLKGGDPALVDRAHRAALEFIKARLR